MDESCLSPGGNTRVGNDWHFKLIGVHLDACRLLNVCVGWCIGVDVRLSTWYNLMHKDYILIYRPRTDCYQWRLHLFWRERGLDQSYCSMKDKFSVETSVSFPFKPNCWDCDGWGWGSHLKGEGMVMTSFSYKFTQSQLQSDSENSVSQHLKYVWNVYCVLDNNQINACALIGQSAVGYCAGKPTATSRVFWIII